MCTLLSWPPQTTKGLTTLLFCHHIALLDPRSRTTRTEMHSASARYWRSQNMKGALHRIRSVVRATDHRELDNRFARASLCFGIAISLFLPAACGMGTTVLRLSRSLRSLSHSRTAHREARDVMQQCRPAPPRGRSSAAIGLGHTHRSVSCTNTYSAASSFLLL